MALWYVYRGSFGCHWRSSYSCLEIGYQRPHVTSFCALRSTANKVLNMRSSVGVGWQLHIFKIDIDLESLSFMCLLNSQPFDWLNVFVK